MKIRQFIPKQKLLATARRLPQRAAMEDFEEPNMSFAKALAVVVVLHVVALGGIMAFSSLKMHRIAPPSPVLHSAKTVAPVENRSTPPDLKRGDDRRPKPQTVASSNPASDEGKSVETAHGKTVGEPAAKPGAKDSGEIYTVVKGDNPVVIARRFHVSYDELLKLNKIEDPKKLQIGQKLHIPVKNKNQ